MASNLHTGRHYTSCALIFPDYATEYKAYYPADSFGYTVLSKATKLGERLALQEWRWGQTTPELFEFLSSKQLRLGSIFYKKRAPIYGGVKSFANEVKPHIGFVKGSNNITVGFVDLSLLFGVHIEKGRFDANGYAVAKTKVILAMMKNDVPALSILQVWYSSVWTTATFDYFQQAVNSLIQQDNNPTDSADKIYLPHSQDEVIGHIKYWSTVEKGDPRLKLEAAHSKWVAQCPPTSNCYYIVNNLCKPRDRVEFARNILTGELSRPDCKATSAKGKKKKNQSRKTNHMSRFGCQNSDLLGSVTMFACLNGYEPHGSSEVLFSGIPMENILAMYNSETTSLLNAVYEFLEENINKIKTWLNGTNRQDSRWNVASSSTSTTTSKTKRASSRVVPTKKRILKISLYKAELTTADCSWLSRNRFKPYAVIWSNVCDYCTKSDFHTIARSLSCPWTTHTMHSMNWPRQTFGAMINDLPDNEIRAECLAEAKTVVRTMGSMLDKSGYFDYRNLKENPSNIGDYFMAQVTHDDWLSYFFENVETGNVESNCRPFLVTSTNVMTVYFAWSYNRRLKTRFCDRFK
ncbi:3759_t:CDS:2 [Paraglomus brasilianum]|uniref:3759_t:CDS:1 n=1 Tax=Paraglomus brasilianum TaxID=144538 RepID=A0A9N8ZRW6_9GLOM|nr:3759_t:CDS:2 [Paraglomus brasilianum]